MKQLKHYSNKAQVTLFMLLAVVLLLLFVFMFLLIGEGSRIPLEFNSESIQGYLDNCLKTTGEDALELLGKQGGRIQLQDYVSAPHYGISLWLKNGELQMPSLPLMEQLNRQPIVESSISKSEDGKWIIHKTIITDIKPMSYMEKVLAATA